MSAGRRPSDTDVLIVGAGPSGLTAARELRALGVQRVVVLDREEEAGGIPRHCFHPGYGVRDLRRSYSGPGYASRLVDMATDSGAELRTATSVTGWAADGAVEVTSRIGLETIRAGAYVLATGARERPRSARLVPGERPLGVWTTGALQQAVYLHGQPIGTRAVVVGSELVSHSAVLTLAHAGVEVVAMTSEYGRAQTYPTVARALPLRHRYELLLATRVTDVIADRTTGRLAAVEVTGPGGPRRIECDVLVFTGDWIPDHELARRGGIELDPGSLAPLVDTGLHTSRRGVFAIGNLVHPVETADLCALDGRAVASRVVAYLSGAEPQPVVPLVASDGVAWVAPGIVRGGAPAPHGRFTVWPADVRSGASVTVTQANNLLHRQRLLDGTVPGRPVGLRAGWVGAVDPTGPPVVVTVG